MGQPAAFFYILAYIIWILITLNPQRYVTQNGISFTFGNNFDRLSNMWTISKNQNIFF